MRSRPEWDEELAFHIEGRAQELMALGWSERDAREEAGRRFGDVDGIRAELSSIEHDRERRIRRFQMRDAVRSDVRFALRALRRNPGFAALAVLTLALGIGATTAIFSVVDGVLLRPLPYAEPDRLVSIFETNPEKNIPEDPPSPPNYMDWKASATRSFAGMTAYNQHSATLTNVTVPEVLSVIGASADFFDVLGIRPLLGRTFQAGEDGNRAGVVVLSWGAWQRLFGGAPDVLGKTMVLNGTATEVIGVMPADFMAQAGIDLWYPADYGSNHHRQSRMMNVLARLAPGVTLEQAEQELDGVAAQLAQAYPVENGGWSTKLVSAREVLVRDVRAALLVVLGAVGFVLLISCANVANLALGRATAREGEMAVRAALGASRTRLHLQMLTESVVLAMLGGVAGAMLAWAGVRAFVGLAPRALPRADEIAVDGRVLAFALAISVLTGVLFGLMPSLRAARTAAAGALRESGRSGVGGRRSEMARRSLIVAEVALALLLLVGAGLALRSVQRLLSVDPGYVTQNVISARVSLDGTRYNGNAPKVRYFQDVMERLSSVQGVAHIGVTSTLPLTHGIDFNLPYHAEGHPDVGEANADEVDYRIISPGYLEAMGIPLLAGRDFTWFDRIDGSPHAAADPSSRAAVGALGSADGPGGHKVMLVNETFAKQHWPGESPIGKRVRLYYVRNDEWEVVGMVGDTRHRGLSTPSAAQVFVPLAQAEVLFGFQTIVARTTPGAQGVVQRLREAAVELDPNEPLYMIETIETLRAEATARDRLAAMVFGAFALLAIVLAAAGIYGVIAYQVARRTREIGVRIALGAARSRVVREVVGEAAGLSLIGVVLGGIGALAATRVAEGMLFGVEASDPLTYVSVSVLLMVVALAAALVPAARAAGIQPVEALRAD